MADIELVIKIDEEMYKWVNDVNKFFGDYGTSDFIDLVKNGTPLPKGHGNLIDYDDLIAKLDTYGRKNVKYQLPYSPTIIFADKEVNADE